MYADDPVMLERRCERLQIEMRSWLSGRRGNTKVFDCTLRSLVDLYQGDPESPYHGLPALTREPYDVYLRVLRKEVGERQIDRWTRGMSNAGLPPGLRAATLPRGKWLSRF